MTTRRDPSPEGTIQLVDYFYESSNGHVDKSRAVSLAASSNNDLLLTEYEDECNQFSGPRSESTNKWSIDRASLIALIKQYGTRV
jgi:hypothetical protein